MGRKKSCVELLLDPGSQVSFISRRIARELDLPVIHAENVTINEVVGQQRSEEHVETVTVTLEGRYSGSRIKITCLAVQQVMQGILPRASISLGFDQAADKKEEGFPETIDVLIGANWLHLVYAGMYKKVGSLTASPTKFGWVFWGDVTKIQVKSSVVTSLACIQALTAKTTAAPERQIQRGDLEDLEFLWRSEFLGIENATSDEEKSSQLQAERFFRETIQRDPDGRYVVSLPFRENKAALGSNEKLAYSCLISFLKRNRNRPQLLAAVDEEITKLIESGYVELAQPRKQSEQAHFLPLLAVAKKSLSATEEPQVRVVKDGGARSQDKASLNDVLEKGPNFLPPIVSVLLNFRRRKIAIICDIERAFHQLSINRQHRTFLRFYWATGFASNPNAPVKQYWGTVLDFGLVCSPWLHCATVKFHLDTEMESHPERKEFLKEVQRSCYMDDVQTSSNTLEEAKLAVQWLVESFEAGKFPLNKWATNSTGLADYIKETQRATTQIATGKNIYKFLGVPWSLEKDVLFIETASTVEFMATGIPTKRKLLKGLSQIFDPLGLIASIAIGLKVLLQTLWTLRVDWDQPLSGEIEDSYKATVANLSFAPNIKIKRTLFGNRVGKSTAVRKELHVFADASLKAYGCIAYIRETRPNLNGKAAVVFVMAKGRVAPLAGKWTIHRLELMAAIVATRVAKLIKESLPESIDETFMYSDNSAVLGWLRDRSDRWKPFIANRIKEIHQYSDPGSWSYVKSAENPADLLSRCSPLDTPALQKFWTQGPSWLARNGSITGTQTTADEPPEEILAERKVQICAAVASGETFKLFEKHFSSWGKIVRIIAYVRRFIKKKVYNRELPGEEEIRTAEFIEAEQKLLRSIQKSYYASEIEKNCDNLPKASALFRLNPFVDDDGWVRCRSRLAKASDLPQATKNPIILPGEDFNVQLFIRELHEAKCVHFGGLAGLLHEMRKHFLITSARRAAKKAIHGCKVCARYRAKAASQPVPPLPAFRIDQCQPFQFTAVDHAGPIYYKNEHTGQPQKSYILLFVCAVTRGLRVELVSDLSTEEFLLALRRFISRNPAVTRLVSDNARSFERASKEIALWFDSVRSAEAQSFLTRKRIEWQFITEKGPQQGAWWERLVQVVKRPLRKCVHTHQMTFRHLEATLAEIEQVVNDRPISAVVTDPDEPQALSPSMLMYGYASQPNLPDTKQILKNTATAKAIIFTERWKKQQSALRAFWKQFRCEYLQYSRSLHYVNPQGRRPLRVGQICILHSNEPSRAYWPLCRVEELFGGEASDGRQRSCKIKTAKGNLLSRPIHLIYPLEIDQF